MHRPVSLLLAAVLTTGGTALAATVAGDPIGAAGRTCTAWATLPARVALTSSGTTIRPQLVGTSGCRADTFDGGATASLRAQGRAADGQRWTHFGDREQIVLYPSLDPVGRYSITAGSVQVYDSREVRVPATWRTTSTDVRYGATFTNVTTSRTSAKAVLQRYTANGWKRSGGTTVSLQRRQSDGWHSVAHKRTTARGAVSFAHAARGQYRLVSVGTGTVWAASTVLGNRT